MAREKTYTSDSVFDGEDLSFSRNADMERLREIESESVKTESGKLGLAGMMAMGAALGMIATSIFGYLLPFDFIQVLHSIFLVLGISSAIYGTIKTLRTLRGKTLNMPSLEVLRKNVTQKQNTANTASYQQNKNTQTVSQNNSQSQTLRRSRKSRVFAGVAGGLAEYMGVSPILVRLAFLIAIPTTSFFFPFIYLLLALVLPKNYDEWKTRNKF